MGVVSGFAADMARRQLYNQFKRVLVGKSRTVDKPAAEVMDDEVVSMLLEMIGRVAGTFIGYGKLLSGAMASLSPKSVAEAINDNPDFLPAVMEQVDPSVIAGAFEGNPQILVDYLSEIDPRPIARRST